MHKLKPYKKDAATSYTLGIYPTLELLRARPELVRQIVLAPNNKHSAGLAEIAQRAQAASIPVVIDEQTLQRLSHSDNCYAIGEFNKFSSELEANKPHVILVNPDDAGNAGTIMRTMLGFGHTDLAIIRPAVDIFDPKVIRASMGALFSLRVMHVASFSEYQQAFAHHPYPFLLQADTQLHQVVLKRPYALVFGNEGAGLPPDYHHVGTPIKIEQSNAIDSLNLAIAAGIALHFAYTHTR